jgi:hypothetical protein
MTGERRTPPADPTSERTADQSTQSASGLTSGTDESARGAGDEREGNRKDEDAERRPATDPTMPSDDSSLNTKI